MAKRKHKVAGVAYKGSSAKGLFCTPSGQRVLLEGDDKRVVAELKRRGLWKQVEPHVRIGNTFMLRDSRGNSMNFFIWIGKTSDGGFAWYSFPGAKAGSPDVHGFIDMMFGGGTFAEMLHEVPEGGHCGQTG